MSADPRCQFGVGEAAALLPAVGLHLPPVGVDPGHQTPPRLRRPALRQLRVARQGGADYYPVHAQLHEPPRVGQGAHSAADLQPQTYRGADGAEHPAVVAAAARGVEINHVQPRGAQVLQLDCGIDRVARIVGGGGEVAGG